MDKIAVMQVCDAMKAGGLERMVVNIANALPRDRFVSHVCTTRGEGPMEMGFAGDVRRLRLRRNGKVDLGSLNAFGRYIREHDIRIVHAHGYAIFYSLLARLFPRAVKIIWHDHFGRYAYDERPRWLYWLAARAMDGIIPVNSPLVEWATKKLQVPAEQVWYLPNFVCEPKIEGPLPQLPGAPGSRIVNVANFRREKDHPNLLRAFRLVLREVPEAHLILLGGANEADYHAEVMKEAATDGLRGHVTWLDSRPDVPAILKACDIGVLASMSEGLPVSLIEYGMASLAAVATDIGQCSEVLDSEKVGLLVPRNDSERLAAALLSFLQSPEKRARMGRAFRKRVDDVYSEGAAMGRIVGIYDRVLGNV